MQHDRPIVRSCLALAGVSCAFALALASTRVEAQAPVPPPPIPGGPTSPPTTAPGANPNATPITSAPPIASPSPTGAPRGKRRRAPASNASASPEPSSTPTSPAFATLDGSWEVQLQYIDRTDYSYLDITQGPSGSLSGRWRVNGKAYPFTGTYDGRTFNISVAGPKGTTTWAGYVEAASDMVGTVDPGDGKPDDKTAFTAEHRQAQKSPFSRDKSDEEKPSPRPTGH